ncbi:hypothetical protein [Streptomyces sp. S186]|uniref:hypothetical protein n=1 Tax=Streptomyces sp. S186 TaxID=3434395 RepID=UPI003F670434
MSIKESSELRMQEIEATLQDVLTHIRPQGHPSWGLNTCLVTNDQLDRWRQAAGLPPADREKSARESRRG